ncbi:MAG: SUMF1/EgtB/PvdO family nonheme iron enzyme [Chloroflexi bacterium]|nr:SUMF1/EgtB/PvdO family nonheme iron enzyme [Chloroflexota bacterium]
MFNQWWNEFVKFLEDWGKNPLVVGITVFIIGYLARDVWPWLVRLLQKASEAVGAFAGGRWQDYQFERKYLDWIIFRHRYLGQLPSNVAVTTGEQKQLAELEKVYVALAVTPGGAAGEGVPDAKSPDRVLRRDKRVWWSRFVPTRYRPDDERPYSNIGRAIEQHPRLVIRGDPGSGKTTLMKYIAVTCARALRNKPREGDDRNAAYDRLGWKVRPFPIFVSLGRHAHVANWDKARTLLDTCPEEFSREVVDRCPSGFFERRLKRGGCIILLDAFDELGNRTARQQMAQHISGLLNQFPNAKNRMVVTTRIVGYEGQLDTCGFTALKVQELTDRDIQSLVRQRYRAIALNESRNRSASEAELAERRAATKANTLLGEIRRNPRLHSLAENPLLLSLIVLDHSVKLALPEDRHILYRDCVEILAAKWRKHSRDELNIQASDDSELSPPQKIVLLQTIALEMQKQRTRADTGQIPIRRARAEELIAGQLPAMLTNLPSDAVQRRGACQHKATAWLEGIKAESGILLELGLDDAGEPLVTFSHLTFQEYLAAVTIKEDTNLYPLLLDNLLNPAWEEVLLLYVGITQQATPIVQKLIAHAKTQTEAWLVAGHCLIERTQIDLPVRQTVLNSLCDLARAGEESMRVRVIEILKDIASPDSAPVFVQIAEQDTVWQVRYTAAQALGKIGDPRFDHLEPELVTVPAGEFVMGSESGEEDEKPQHRVALPAYRIGKYPVTNAEYKRFVDETGHAAPARWNENTYRTGEANHPVVIISWQDAQAYCQWLGKKTGKQYRLPSEAEWEKAARGTDAREYPWGNEFSKDKCNTSESQIGMTTPVGIYTDGASPCGAFDMAGNVWEWCNSLYSPYPYKPDDGREQLIWKEPKRSIMVRLLRRDAGSGNYERRVLRGGSWGIHQDGARCAYRPHFDPHSRSSRLGFRVAESFPGLGSAS